MRRVRVKYLHWIPRALGVEGIVLYPYVLFRGAKPCTTLLAHELIHVRQVRARGWFRFYVSYLGEYLRGRLRGLGHHAAYRQISYEAEAYREQARIELTPAERRELG